VATGELIAASAMFREARKESKDFDGGVDDMVNVEDY
jgi:hypothetical protein